MALIDVANDCFSEIKMDMLAEKKQQIVVAGNLRKTRRFSSTVAESQKPSEGRRRNSDLSVDKLPLSLKIRRWFGSSDSGIDLDHSQGRTPIDSISEDKSDTEGEDNKHSTLVDEIPEKLQNELSDHKGALFEVPWQLDNCNLLIHADSFYLPVSRYFLIEVSGYFRRAVLSIDDDCNVLEMDESFELDEVLKILKFMYCVNKEKVCDKNVASLLQLAHQFEVKKLFKQCVRHLEKSPTFNPIIAVQLSFQYSLNTVLECACVRLSKIEGIEDTTEFESLDCMTQNEVMRLALNRYKRGKHVITNMNHQDNNKQEYNEIVLHSFQCAFDRDDLI